MCGISGFISKKRITVEQLITMNDTMLHRGPDDSGAEIFVAWGWRSGGFPSWICPRWGISRCIRRTAG